MPRQLYTAQEAARWKRRASLALGASVFSVALALLVCIVLCCLVNTANAGTLLAVCIVLFTLAGWTAILLSTFAYRPCRAQSEHIRGMLAGQAECMEGVLTLNRETFCIPGSIMVRRAVLQTENGPVTLNVSASLAGQLPGGQRLRLWTVRSFITACEVIE